MLWSSDDENRMNPANVTFYDKFCNYQLRWYFAVQSIVNSSLFQNFKDSTNKKFENKVWPHSEVSYPNLLLTNQKSEKKVGRYSQMGWFWQIFTKMRNAGLNRVTHFLILVLQNTTIADNMCFDFYFIAY